MPWPTPKTSFDESTQLRLKKDETIKVAILDNEPDLYYVHFLEAEHKTVKCGGESCAPCMAGNRKLEKGSIRVVDQSDGKEKVLSGTSALFLSIKEVFDMCGGKDGFIFSMKATGEKASRRYHIVPVPIKTRKVDQEAIPF